ncbi:MAG: cyclic pyranopterin monophosphate synthase MoaC [Myxococcota bacterium]|nr:cyclic pyranopterin monophosphate synthase MoaC [Myxococcota bacterium]
MRELTHINQKGEARMVDIGPKNESERVAVAQGHLQLSKAALKQLEAGQVKKGDPLATARIAAIMAAKETSRLIPLCHPLRLSSVNVDLRPSHSDGVVYIEVEVRAFDRTGVEMEALTATSVAALTLYDMLKSVDHEMTIGGIELVSKRGGKREINRALPLQSLDFSATEQSVTESDIIRSDSSLDQQHLPRDRGDEEPERNEELGFPKRARSRRSFQVVPKSPAPPLQTQIETQSFDELDEPEPTSLDESSESAVNSQSEPHPDSPLGSAPQPPIPLRSMAQGEESELSLFGGQWEESLLVDNVDELSVEEIELLSSPPEFSPEALRHIDRVTALSVDDARLRMLLENAPVRLAYLAGFLDPAYESECHVSGLISDGEISSLLFQYDGLSRPAIWSYGQAVEIESLLAARGKGLPRRIFWSGARVHSAALRCAYALKGSKPVLRMGLERQGYLSQLESDQALTQGLGPITTLTHQDTGSIISLYRQYPDHLFEPAQLDTGLYFGMRDQEGHLISVAGIHSLSPQLKLAVIGNIVTDVAHRGRGLASLCVSTLLEALFERGFESIALDVSEDNQAAIRCYHKFGFQIEQALLEAQGKLR